MQFLVFLFLVLASCASEPSVVSYTSTPSWSSGREAKIPTKLGELRLFNANCGYEVDVALLGEIFDRHVMVEKLDKKLELRVFPECFVFQTDKPLDFHLTNTPNGFEEMGGTFSEPDVKLVIAVVPTGWAQDNVIFESNCGVIIAPRSAGTLLTMTAIHELVGHGVKRAALIPRTEKEECDAQILGRQVVEELQGRVAFRRGK